MTIIKPVTDYTVHGIPVATARIKDVDQAQGIVICDLLDEDGRVLAFNRYFYLDGSSAKSPPFTPLTQRERAALGLETPPSQEASGLPDESWTKSDIQAWLESQDIPYSKKASKAKLLDIIKHRPQA